MKCLVVFLVVLVAITWVCGQDSGVGGGFGGSAGFGMSAGVSGGVGAGAGSQGRTFMEHHLHKRSSLDEKDATKETGQVEQAAKSSGNLQRSIIKRSPGNDQQDQGQDEQPK